MISNEPSSVESLRAPSYEAIESRILSLGHRIFEGVDARKVSTSWWYAKMMDLATRDPRVKTQLFRFVDVLPVLQTLHQKKKELLEYLARPKNFEGSWPRLLSLASFALRIPGLSDFVAEMAVKNVQSMGKVFIVGSDLKTAATRLRRRRETMCRGFTLDILGESILSDLEAEHYRDRYHRLIADLTRETVDWPFIPQIDSSALGPIPKANISIKISALDCRIDPCAFEASLERLMSRLLPLLRAAKEGGIFVNFDMEFFDLCELTRELFKRVLFHPEFINYRHLGIVCQAYLQNSLDQVSDWIATARRRGTPFTIRLVKGAYWDFEVIHASQNGWSIPVFSQKAATDANFEACSRELLRAYPSLELALGSHNIRSIASSVVFAETLDLPRDAYELQMLYGMAEPFKDSLIDMKFRLREYDPVGELLPGLSYLVRRLLENSSNDSFLKQSFMNKKEIKELLRDPQCEVRDEIRRIL